jgi:hypothetical protein
MKEDWRKEALKNAEDWAGKIAIEKVRGKKIRSKKKKRIKKKSLSVFAVSGGLPFSNRSKH